MKDTYHERPQQPLCKFEEIQREGTKLFQQGMVLWACWPVENEPLMWQIAQCHVCRRAPAHWVGVGDPSNQLARCRSVRSRVTSASVSCPQ